MNISTTTPQTVSTAAMQPLSLQPASAVHGTVAWSLTPGPVTTQSTGWHPQLPQHQSGWLQQPNTIPPWPGTWNPATNTYAAQPTGHTLVLWMTTGLHQPNWQATLPYQAQLHPTVGATAAQIPTSTDFICHAQPTR